MHQWWRNHFQSQKNDCQGQQEQCSQLILSDP